MRRANTIALSLFTGLNPKKKKYLIPRWIPGYNETLQFYLPLGLRAISNLSAKI